MTVSNHVQDLTHLKGHESISFDDDDYGGIIPSHDDPLAFFGSGCDDGGGNGGGSSSSGGDGGGGDGGSDCNNGCGYGEEDLRARPEKFINLEDYKHSRDDSGVKVDLNNFEKDFQRDFQRRFKEKRKWEKFDNYTTPLNASRRRVLKEVFQASFVNVAKPPPLKKNGR
ncbi:uncharacterized protein LOC133309340 [Gastrolobium bilobum]|uniref:uncharacterized protein LOC133309340 n=1 Tax=Gastrolobium bilobum TaxID=150636 RepID=UPI002AB226E8|nr:uncharacterized protein LOC133309340 [Gastrolobium bilobum]